MEAAITFREISTKVSASVCLTLATGQTEIRVYGCYYRVLASNNKPAYHMQTF